MHDSRRSASLTKALQATDGRPRTLTTVGPMAPDDDPYFLQLNAFARAIRRGEPLAVTAEEAKSAIALGLAAQESSRTGRAVEIVN